MLEEVELGPKEDTNSVSEDVVSMEDLPSQSLPMDKSTDSESEDSEAKTLESQDENSTTQEQSSDVQIDCKPKPVSLFDSSSLDQSMDSLVSADSQESWKPKPTIKDAYSQEELEWVSSLVSLQTELLRHKLGRSGEQTNSRDLDTSLECNERLPSQDRFEDLPTGARSPNSSTVSGISYSGKVAAEHQLLEQLQDYLITHSEVDNLDPIILKYLAAKQINKLLPSRTTLLQSNVRSRASLTPVGSRVQPYYMQYRTLDIGTGPDIHLNLRDFGHCNNLSARHATLFYDELSGQYELINYSPFGTQVDECLYSLDTAVITMRYKNTKVPESGGPVMAAPGSAQTPCYCAPLYPPQQQGDAESEGEDQAGLSDA